MGKITKVFGAIGAAAAVSAGSGFAQQAEVPPELEASNYYRFVEQFRVAQILRTEAVQIMIAKVKAGQEAPERISEVMVSLYRGGFEDDKAQLLADRKAMQAQLADVRINGVNGEQCSAVNDLRNSLAARHELLIDFDRAIRRRELPGPLLYGTVDSQSSVLVYQNYSQIMQAACAKIGVSTGLN